MDDPTHSLEKTPQAPTYYDILGISEALLQEQADPSRIIKKAYHRAILRNHPDKSRVTDSVSYAQSMPTSSSLSIDQISEAFRVLSNPRTRADYDRSLSGARRGLAMHSFQTGIESMDLDDLEFDETENYWFRGCRCGNLKGYLVREADLEEVEDQGELIVGCQDCSLWLKVHFAVLKDDGESQRNEIKSS